jgi:hypothetical protein
MATEGKKRRKRPREEEDSEVSEPTSEQPAPVAEADTKARPPFVPLFWLLIPFIAVLAYGLLTR